MSIDESLISNSNGLDWRWNVMGKNLLVVASRKIAFGESIRSDGLTVSDHQCSSRPAEHIPKLEKSLHEPRTSNLCVWGLIKILMFWEFHRLYCMNWLEVKNVMVVVAATHETLGPHLEAFRFYFFSPFLLCSRKKIKNVIMVLWWMTSFTLSNVTFRRRINVLVLQHRTPMKTNNLSIYIYWVILRERGRRRRRRERKALDCGWTTGQNCPLLHRSVAITF